AGLRPQRRPHHAPHHQRPLHALRRGGRRPEHGVHRPPRPRPARPGRPGRTWPMAHRPDPRHLPTDPRHAHPLPELPPATTPPHPSSPPLRHATLVADPTVRVGLRPARTSGVRLERQPGTRILHNVGHGGSGVTLSWGCAEETVTLLHRLARSQTVHA